MSKIVTVIDGSLNADRGNTSRFVEPLLNTLKKEVSLELLKLSRRLDRSEALDLLGKSRGFVFYSGTYWDSWGSPLQRFLEDFTETEGSPIWLGKPAVVVISMHSVGGKEVASRLMGVLNCFGMYVPPFGAMSYSLSNKLALEADSEHSADFWCEADLQILSHNLLQAINKTFDWKAWEIDREDAGRIWV